jgi:hypothetical protein
MPFAIIEHANNAEDAKFITNSFGANRLFNTPEEIDCYLCENAQPGVNYETWDDDNYLED